MRKSIAASLHALADSATMDAVRGIEGEAARRYFGALKLLARAGLRDSFAMDDRTRRWPRACRWD